MNPDTHPEDYLFHRALNRTGGCLDVAAAARARGPRIGGLAADQLGDALTRAVRAEWAFLEVAQGADGLRLVVVRR